MTSTPVPSITRSDEEWRAELSHEEYAVLREAATERPFTGEYHDEFCEGVYSCRACGSELFTSMTKFHSHCGWPSFYAPSGDDKVILRRDTSLVPERTEVLCRACGSHLGHVFAGEGYDTPTDQRYCINSVSLSLRPATGSQG